MRKLQIIIIVIATFMSVNSSAQKLEYDGILTATIHMSEDEFDVLDLFLVSSALIDLKIADEKAKNWVDKFMRDSPNLAKDVEASRIEKFEPLNIQVDYVVDTRGKIDIKIEAEGQTFMEFGKSKQQNLLFHKDEDDEDFYIAIANQEFNSVGLLYYEDDGTIRIFLGDFSSKGDFETMYFMSKDEHTSSNKENFIQLRTNLQKLFKPDENGYLLIEYE